MVIHYLEHARYITVEQPDKSSLAEHCIATGLIAQFHCACVLAKNLEFGEGVITKGTILR